MIQVVLADDHSVVRRGIREFLTEAGDITVIAEAENGAEALDLIRQKQPDVALLDVQMPNYSGIEVTRQLRAAHLSLGILILTAFDDPPYIRAALDAGANGYVLKSAEADEIIEAVRAVYEGKTVLTVTLPTAQNLPTMPPSSGILSERELAVLRLVARGLTNKAIGFDLTISDRTVQGHLANIYEKLSVSGRAEAIARAISLGLLTMTSL